MHKRIPTRLRWTDKRWPKTVVHVWGTAYLEAKSGRTRDKSQVGEQGGGKGNDSASCDWRVFCGNQQERCHLSFYGDVEYSKRHPQMMESIIQNGTINYCLMHIQALKKSSDKENVVHTGPHIEVFSP